MNRGKLDLDDARHLLRRLCFTSTPKQASALRGRSPGDAFDIVWKRSETASDVAWPTFLEQSWTNSALALEGMTVAEFDVRRAAQLQEHQRQTEQLRQAWLTQMVASPAALRENLLLFFHGLFGSWSAAVEIPQALHARNALIRSEAMTALPELLTQLVLDPAMMIQIGMEGHSLDRVSDRPAKLILDCWTVGEGAYAADDIEARYHEH